MYSIRYAIMLGDHNSNLRRHLQTHFTYDYHETTSCMSPEISRSRKHCMAAAASHLLLLRAPAIYLPSEDWKTERTRRGLFFDLFIAPFLFSFLFDIVCAALTRCLSWSSNASRFLALTSPWTRGPGRYWNTDGTLFQVFCYILHTGAGNGW